DVLKDVPYARPPFDLVFLDPPYACAAAEVLGLVVALRTRAALSDDAIVVYEHASAANDEVEEAAKARDLSIAQRKKYGDTVVDVLRATALHDAID
ncbi:MAG: RsmD family RNA methyltransferase, partial [Eggerthella lenta]